MEPTPLEVEEEAKVGARATAAQGRQKGPRRVRRPLAAVVAARAEGDGDDRRGVSAGGRDRPQSVVGRPAAQVLGDDDDAPLHPPTHWPRARPMPS